jgi:hypothetical protein
MNTITQKLRDAVEFLSLRILFSLPNGEFKEKNNCDNTSSSLTAFRNGNTPCVPLHKLCNLDQGQRDLVRQSTVLVILAGHDIYISLA